MGKPLVVTQLDVGQFSLTRLGVECDSTQALVERICSTLSTTLPEDLMACRVVLDSAILPRGIEEFDTFRSTYERVVHYYTSHERMSHEHEHEVYPRRDGCKWVERRDGCKCNTRAVMAANGSSAVMAASVCNVSTCAGMAACASCAGMAAFSQTDARREGGTREAVHRHLQRKLLGFALRKIDLAQDFMANFCYEDDRGFLTEEVKRMVVKLNDALTPWAVLVGKIATHKRLTEIASWYRSGDPTDGVTVYARVNLRAPGDLYVGETKRWEQRVKQHYVATCKHRIGAPKPCSRCIEHGKYKKHRAAQPHQWIMIPIIGS